MITTTGLDNRQLSGRLFLQQELSEIEYDVADGQHDGYNVGKALQRLRKDNDWTLSAVAEKTGVSVSALSKIENNLSSPSFDVMVRLAEGLGMDLLKLLKYDSFATFASGTRVIDRKGGGVQYETLLGKYWAFGAELEKKSMQPGLICLPKGEEKPAVMSTHGSEEYVYVLRGPVKFYMEPYRATVLEEGDSVYFDSLMPHAFIAVGEQDAFILSINLFDESISKMFKVHIPKMSC